MKKSFGTLTQVLIGFIIGLSSVFCWIDDVPRIDVTCESDLMKVQFKFQRPFKGMVYTNEYSWNPACSFQVPQSADVLLITLKIPYVACGTHIDYVPNGHSIISNTITVQQQRTVRTLNDSVNPVSCTILGLHESFSELKPKKNLDDEIELSSEASLEVNIGQDFLGSDLAKELRLFNEPILVFRAKNTGKYRDMDVKSCIIHENKILGGQSLVYQLTRPSECEDLPTDIISTFTLFNVTNPDELISFAQLRLLQQKLSLVQNIHITCGAQLCRKMCKRNCAKKASNDFFAEAATHKIAKRSLSEETEQPSAKEPSNLRNRLLKATVDILNNKFFQSLREKTQSESFRKRSEDEESGDFSNDRTQNELQDTRGQIEPEPMTFETLQKEIRQEVQPREMSKAETSISKNVQSGNILKLSKHSQKGAKKLSEKNRNLMKDLARKLASRSQKLKEHNEKFKDLVKTAKEENFPLNEFLIDTSDTSNKMLDIGETTDPETDHDASEAISRKTVKNKRSKLDNFEVTTAIQEVTELGLDEMYTTDDESHEVTELSKDILLANSQQDELKQSTDTISIISVIEGLTNQPTLVQTISQEPLPSASIEPNLTKNNSTGTIPTERFHTTSMAPHDISDDFSKTTLQDLSPHTSMELDYTLDDFSETPPREISASSMKPQYTLDNKCIYKTPDDASKEINNEQKLLTLKNSFKISKGTFAVASILIGFFVFLLIATVIGLFLYIRKEKRRHAIDNFLLYNFY